MSVELLTLALIVSLFVFLFLGFPVAFSLIGVSFLFYFILEGPAAMYTLVSITLGTGMKDIYIAAPLFVFMAAVLEFSGLGIALYDAMYKWSASLSGGLAIGTIAMCTIIAACTGIGATGIVTIGMLALPEMLKRGYNKDLAVGCIPFGGALGPLIPPSVLMIIVGGFGAISIGRLFMGGVFPGLLASFLAIAYIYIKCRRNPTLAPALPPDARATWTEKLRALVLVLPTILLIIVVLGSLYAGVCTTSEAGGVGAIGALICAAIFRKLNWPNLKRGALMTLQVSAMLFWLLIGGGMFASIMSVAGISHSISNALAGMSIPPMGILAVMMVIVFILGMIMDGAAITMICMPIFLPVVIQLGIDTLWFGLLFTINLIIGYISPPFGMCLFYTKGITPPTITMADIYRASWPYVAVLVIVLILGIVFPDILLWLPNRMIK